MRFMWMERCGSLEAMTCGGVRVVINVIKVPVLFLLLICLRRDM
jgi:hypothetical protein